MPSTDLTIREARMGDLESIYSIEEKSFLDPYPRGLLKAFFFMPGAYLSAVVGSEVVGYAVGVIRYGTVGHIVSLAVLEECRGKGIGARLLEKLMDGLAALGAEDMRLEVRESNIKAKSLYRAAGFQEKEIIKKYYADGESALVMWLTWSQRPRK
jgi:ribosomal-protein-alanine N-acetyltransferase